MTRLDFISMLSVEIDVQLGYTFFSFLLFLLLELFLNEHSIVTECKVAVVNVRTVDFGFRYHTDCCCRPDAAVSAASNQLFIDSSTTIMLDYVRQRPSPTSSFSLIFISFLWRIWMCWNLFSSCLHGIETSQSIDQSSSLRNIFQLRQTQIQQQLPNKKFLRIIYYRDFDSTIDEIRLKSAVKNLTESYNIDLKIQIFEQSQTLSVYPLCSLLSQEQRDTIIIADLYTKEIDFISRALKIPTIAYTNRYQIVQGKLVSVIDFYSIL